MGGEILKLLIEGVLGMSLWGAYEVYKGGIAKLYL